MFGHMLPRSAQFFEGMVGLFYDRATPFDAFFSSMSRIMFILNPYLQCLISIILNCTTLADPVPIPSYFDFHHHLQITRCDWATLGGNQEDQSESVGSGRLGLTLITGDTSLDPLVNY